MKNLAQHMRISALNVSDDEVKSRKSAAEALRATWAKIKTIDSVLSKADAISIALASDLPPPGLANEIELAIQQYSPAFLANERPFDVGICSAMAALDLLAQGPPGDGFAVADILAHALWSALNFQPPLGEAKREALRLEVLESARGRALSTAEASRNRSNVEDFGAFVAVAGDDTKTSAAFKKATGETIKALRRNAALDREEIDFLWWTLAKRSRLLKKPFRTIDEPVRLVVAGIEAGQCLRRFPCDVHRELVLRNLDVNTALNLSALLDAHGAFRETLVSEYPRLSEVGSFPSVLPLMNALVSGSAAVTGADIERTAEDWGARALLEASLSRMRVTGIVLL